MRNLLLPIPSEPSLKADVSGVSFAKFQYFEGNWLYCSNRFKCQKLTLHFFHYCLTAEQVGRLQCSLLLVVGEDDQNWPSYESALDVSWRTFLLIVLYGMVFIFSVRIKAYVSPWPLLRNVIWLYQQLVRYKLWLFYSYSFCLTIYFWFFFFFRWKRWWKKQGMFTCLLSCLIPTLVIWLSLHTRHIPDTATLCLWADGKKVGSSSDWKFETGSESKKSMFKCCFFCFFCFVCLFVVLQVWCCGVEKQQHIPMLKKTPGKRYWHF